MRASSNAEFHTTRWSQVLQAQDQSEPAMQQLCQRYWFPLYAFVRRRGYDAPDAEDLTQEFFARLLEKGWLQAVDRGRGKFRTFLLMAMKRFLANEWDRTQRLKRGGAVVFLSLDGEDAERRYAADSLQGPVDESVHYDRAWALTLLHGIVQRLEEEQDTAKFRVLKDSLIADRGEFDCTAAASELGISEGAARVAVHRLRKRFRHLLRAEIADTVESPDEVNEEILHLLRILARE